MKSLLGIPLPPYTVLAAVLLVAAYLSFLALRPRGGSLVLSSWPQPLWLYIQALAAIGKRPSKKGTEAQSGGKAIQVALSRPVHCSAPRLRSYLALAGFREGTAGAVPLLYPLVEGFRLVIQAMLLPAFPFNVLGSVLGRTRVVALRRVGAEEKLMYSCRVEPAFRTTAKGDTEVDLVLEAHGLGGGSAGVGGAPGYQMAWRSVTTAIILAPRRGRRPQTAAGKEPAGAADAGNPPEAAAATGSPNVIDTWLLAGDTGRRYGLLNGDLNPIHLYPATSQLFGFKRPIAHALYLTGRAEASLRNTGLQLPYPCVLAADFKRPTLLPATLHCAWLTAAGGGGGDPAGSLGSAEGARFGVFTEDLAKEVLVGWVSSHPDTVKAALHPAQ